MYGSAPSAKCRFLGMGNPLLDISAPVSDDFIKQYDIKMASACLAEDKHKPMYGEMSAMPEVVYTAGGATMNTVRVVQWASGKPAGHTAYIGCIGKDDFGRKLQECVQGAGVSPCFSVDAETPTGTCAVCLKDKERALVANLEAANKYPVEHFDKEGEQYAMQSQVIYSSGFFLTVCPAAMVKAAEIAQKAGGIYSINLAAEFIVQVFKDPLAKLMPMCDFVFGNETEAKAYAGANGLKDDSPAGVAKHIATLPFTKPGHRVCVITSGSEKTVLARGDGLYLEVPVVKLSKDAIVDVNSAGDAFVGGFFVALMDGKDFISCVEMGHKCSRYIIQQSGCVLQGASSNLVDLDVLLR